MSKLAAGINASVRRLTLDEAVSGLEPGDLVRLGDETLRFLTYGTGRRGLAVDTTLVVTRGAEGSTPASHLTGAELVTGPTLLIAATYDGTSSFQPVAADLELGADAGNVGTNPKFLAPMMGNLLGADLTKAGAYLAGVIAALSVTGARATHYQVGAILGVIMDGVTDADGAVVAVIDGSDPSAATRANAAFAARMNNNHAGSGVDYGLDLLGPANEHFSGTGKALAIAKALLRSPHGVCYLEGDGVPVDGTTGDNFAGKGSQYHDYTNGEIYVQTGIISNPVWKKVTHAA